MSSAECCQRINKKSFLITSLFIFVAIFITDFLIHGLILKGQYEATASLWRSESEMQGVFHWMLIGQAVIALFFTRLFTHGYQNKGIKEGVCFGFMFAGIFAGNDFILYTVTAYPMSLVWAWIGTRFAQSILLGVIAAKVYKQK